MSFNQSRSDKSDPQYRKSGLSAGSNQQRTTSSGAYSKGGGPVPSPSSSISSNRSFKKSSNAQGGQSRINIPAVNSSYSANASAAPNVQNGGRVQSQLHGVSGTPVPIGTAKPNETPQPHRGTGAVPKAPTSQSATISSDTALPVTPAKASGDASKAFPFQFGSISPGFMNGMQIPARTSSAPLNFDEQQHDQARHDTLRSVPSLPTLVPRQQLSRKEVGVVDQSTVGEVHQVRKAKKDVLVSIIHPVPPASQTPKSSILPLPLSSMQRQFHQPPVSVHFGGPNPQIQSQGVTPCSLQVPMPMTALPMGNASVQQSMFVQGLHPHPMPPQGMMHQGQGLSFTRQIGPQIPPQLGNLGTQQCPQQQGGKFGGPRKTTVKITDPKTHEELTLDKRTDTYADGGSSVPRSHPNMPPQSQPIPSFTPSHPINYYNSYIPNNIFFQSSSSLLLTSGQIAPNSQLARFNYSVSQGPQHVSFVNSSSLNSLSVSKSGTSIHGLAEHACDAHNVVLSASSGPVQVKVKPAARSIQDKVADSLSSNSLSADEKSGSMKPSRLYVEDDLSLSQKDSENVPDSSLQLLKNSSESSALKSLSVASRQSAPIIVDSVVPNSSLPATPAQSEETMVSGSNTEGKKKETLSRSNSIKDQRKKPDKKGYVQSQNQIGEQSTSISMFSSRSSEPVISSNCGDSDPVETKATLTLSSGIDEGRTESIQESIPKINASEVSEAKNDDFGEGCFGTSKISSALGIVNAVSVAHQVKIGNSSPQEQLKYGTPGTEVHEEKGITGSSKQEDSNSEITSKLITSKFTEVVNQWKKESASTVPAPCNDVPALQEGQDVPVTYHAESNRMLDNMDVSKSINLESEDILTLDAASSTSDNMSDKEVHIIKSSASNQQFTPFPTSSLSEATSKHDAEVDSNAGSVSDTVCSSKDKAAELIRSKSTSRLKKKRKEILQKADAGTTSDLYMAYKGPEENKESVVSSELKENTSTSFDLQQAPADTLQADSMNKVEPDDWEDAADISTPKLESTDDGVQDLGILSQHGQFGNLSTAKKYSRDFLLKFSDHFIDLPKGFEIVPDVSEVFINPSYSPSVELDPSPGPGRGMDRSNSGSLVDHRASGMTDDDRWNKLPGTFGIVRDSSVDIGGNAGFRPGQGGSYGVLRNPRTHSPGQYAGGILLGSLQSMGSQGGIQRNSPDADRWQRATNFQQKGLIPSPQTPLQMMHKAEKKYEVGKVTDEEQSKQRQLKAILNKLTPQNFEKLFEQVKAVNIDNAVTLIGVISQIFDKALMEPTFCEMYANFCYHLAGGLPDFTEEHEKITFKRLLLNKCQEEFERGEREEEEANKADEEGATKQTEEEREEKRVKARRRMLGNIRLIGELYKKKMLTERIMHECIKKLLGQYQNPDEEDVEALCKLMSTIGEMIDHPRAKEFMDAYFDMMAKLSNNMKLSSRVRFMLKDAIDLRKNKWQQRRKVEGPKKIEQVHRDAVQERHHQASRLARNASINTSSRRMPIDFGPRVPATLSSPNAQMGGFHGLPAQVRGYGSQDVRLGERSSYDARTLSAPLPRPLIEDSITLGPQGGLARGMSIRGPPVMASTHGGDISAVPGDSRRMTAVMNGFSSSSERSAFGSREDFIPRYAPDRFAVPATFNQLRAQEHNMNYVNRDPRIQDRSSDRPFATSPPARAQVAAFTRNIPSERVWPEERLRDMSMEAIKEFYSARDEKEVVLCIKELNSSSFYPSMISLWVTDSFERKDMERDHLAKLLVNLSRSQDSILSPSQLVKGFELVLTTLEDAVNDAPKAAEFLSRIFGKVVIEGVVSLGEIGKLLYEGGEEPGSLVEVGLAGDVLGSTLEVIKAEKGESVLNEIRISSNLHLEDFRPPEPNSSRILERFI